MSNTEELKFAETVADSLREVYFTTIGNAGEPLRLDLLELCEAMGGTVYEITSYSAKDDYNMLEIEEDGLFSIRLNSLGHMGVPYKSSPRLAMAIGDWLLNFTNAEPGACRTYSSVYRNPQGKGAASYELAVHFGWQLLLPADLFESVWWLNRCDFMKVARDFGVDIEAACKRADQLNLPRTPPSSLQEQEERKRGDEHVEAILKSVLG
mgnify:FL=1